MEKVFHFSGPMLSGMSNLKTPSWVFCCIDRARYFWGSWVFFWVVFHFIVVPCCPMSQKPRDVDKKTPNWVFCGIDRDGYFGATGYFGVGWRKFSIL